MKPKEQKKENKKKRPKTKKIQPAFDVEELIGNIKQCQLKDHWKPEEQAFRLKQMVAFPLSCNIIFPRTFSEKVDELAGFVDELWQYRDINDADKISILCDFLTELSSAVEALDEKKIQQRLDDCDNGDTLLFHLLIRDAITEADLLAGYFWKHQLASIREDGWTIKNVVAVYLFIRDKRAVEPRWLAFIAGCKSALDKGVSPSLVSGCLKYLFDSDEQTSTQVRAAHKAVLDCFDFNGCYQGQQKPGFFRAIAPIFGKDAAVSSPHSPRTRFLRLVTEAPVVKAKTSNSGTDTTAAASGDEKRASPAAAHP